MAVTVTGKLNKAATQFQAGESVGFGVRIGVQYYDRETKTQAWCNYEAVIFAKAPAQIQFYQSVLVEGTVIEISGHKQRIRQFQGANGLNLSIEILDAQLGVAYAPPVPAQQQPAQQQRAPAQQPYNQQPAQQYGYKNGAATPNTHGQQQAYNQAPAQPAYNQAPQGGQQYNHNPNVAMVNGQPQNIDFDDDIPF